MMTRQRPNPVRLSRCLGTLATGLLLLAPLAQADTDQLQKALIQTEASLKSLEQGDAQGAAAHAEAARTHVEIASREARGSLKNDLNTCRSRLKDVERDARAGHPNRARTAARQAESHLQKLQQP
jgi:hypothetical protein